MPRRPDRQILVNVDWLAAHVHDANLRIMDARVVPPTDAHPRGDALYAAGHIPGAIFVHWRQDLSANTPPVPNLLLAAEPFAAKMGQCGVNAETTVIVYDPGDENWAARIWWALKYYGHEKVYVLQGGAAAWQAAGHPWTTAVVQPLHTTFVAQAAPCHACHQGPGTQGGARPRDHDYRNTPPTEYCRSWWNGAGRFLAAQHDGLCLSRGLSRPHCRGRTGWLPPGDRGRPCGLPGGDVRRRRLCRRCGNGVICTRV